MCLRTPRGIPFVLDCGCGTGSSTFGLALSRPDLPIVGVDRSRDRLTRRNSFKMGRIPPNILLLRAELTDLWYLLALEAAGFDLLPLYRDALERQKEGEREAKKGFILSCSEDDIPFCQYPQSFFSEEPTLRRVKDLLFNSAKASTEEVQDTSRVPPQVDLRGPVSSRKSDVHKIFISEDELAQILSAGPLESLTLRSNWSQYLWEFLSATEDLAALGRDWKGRGGGEGESRSQSEGERREGRDEGNPDACRGVEGEGQGEERQGASERAGDSLDFRRASEALLTRAAEFCIKAKSRLEPLDFMEADRFVRSVLVSMRVAIGRAAIYSAGKALF
uniref:Methyltransferase domain-containing protein n=1 Tax=Chromera velia CCMP2878 TaxID=1169474 RepID=A0A0G4F3P6_9ALVE|eukprot:Cvel_14913.t1-p1 / transcript=Cvel_14913.t1 / gene=Cvel_14913 / organism=Chromera_velia_CCMP2878 / gene_product=hypothetical protein / transcript_product=hypothetical protein / location=Cvel_scaffold1080:47463-48779(+) / protein_length=333 / sequence_SO=supercontig / SO=protein_coding / is_pseudo=false